MVDDHNNPEWIETTQLISNAQKYSTTELHQHKFRVHLVLVDDHIKIRNGLKPRSRSECWRKLTVDQFKMRNWRLEIFGCWRDVSKQSTKIWNLQFFQGAKLLYYIPLVGTICVLVAKVDWGLKISCSCHNFHMCSPRTWTEQLVDVFWKCCCINISELVPK